jgi:hypothetical protein
MAYTGTWEVSTLDPKESFISVAIHTTQDYLDLEARSLTPQLYESCRSLAIANSNQNRYLLRS